MLPVWIEKSADFFLVPDVSAVGGELAFSMCAFFARQMQQQLQQQSAATPPHTGAAAASSDATAPATDVPSTPSDSTVSNAQLAADPVTPGEVPAVPAQLPPNVAAAAASTLPPVDLLPSVSALASSTRRALLASLLAGDLTEEFTQVFAASKQLPDDIAPGTGKKTRKSAQL